MANISIGRKLMIGTVSSRPMRSLSQPHWKMATSTPKLAAMLSRIAMRRLDRHEDRTEHDEQQHASSAR